MIGWMELEYALTTIACELEWQSRGKPNGSDIHRYWRALIQLSDQLPSNLVTVYPARSEGLVAVGNWAEHHPYPIERYPPDLRDIEVLNKRLQTLASARCDEFLADGTLPYSFGFRAAVHGETDIRTSDLMDLRQTGRAGTGPIGYLWTSGEAHTTLDVDTLQVTPAPSDGKIWIQEDSDLRKHRDRRYYTTPLEAFGRIACGVMRWAAFNYSCDPPALVSAGTSAIPAHDERDGIRLASIYKDYELPFINMVRTRVISESWG